jgi:predicted homoserine dehydrogenase-like protein
MNTEFHITTGSAFVGKGLVTEAEGDQPGVLAALHLDAVAMGFEPIAYGNMKGFMNLDPTREDMEFWGAKQGISLSMVTSFTDGTKVQAEQILVGNHFGAGITDQGMMGPPVNGIEDAAQALVAESEELGGAVTDFVVGSSLPHGVFIVATHAEDQAAALEYFKMGPGPHYTIVRPNIFVHLEILKTIRGVLEREDILLDNSGQPTLSLGAVAKRDLAPGEKVEMGIGSFDLRGQAVRIAEHPDHLPIGLIVGATMESPIERGQLVSFSDMSLPESSATGLWRSWERTDAGSQ